MHRFLVLLGDTHSMLLLPAAVGLLATPLGKLLVALIVMSIVVLLGRFVLNVAWKLVVVATVVVGIIFVYANVL